MNVEINKYVDDYEKSPRDYSDTFVVNNMNQFYELVESQKKTILSNRSDGKYTSIVMWGELYADDWEERRVVLWRGTNSNALGVCEEFNPKYEEILRKAND